MEVLDFLTACLVSCLNWSLFQLAGVSIGVFYAFRFFFRLATASRKQSRP